MYNFGQKINNIIAVMNDDKLKKEQEIKKKQKKEYALKRKKEIKKIKEKYQKKKEHDKKERDKKKIEVQNEINKKIMENINIGMIDAQYNKFKKNKRPVKKYSFGSYKKGAIDRITNYVKNNELLKTESFKFAKKEVYVVSAKKRVFDQSNINDIMKISSERIINELNKYTKSFFSICERIT